ncbi:Hypothetical predicted protein [Pelobates cultripes]|uniref:Uncharacterized protein n=1 Tax=Pelobates cultripes TaxID=61616 RepID=A0AAD1WIG2_PELCU|nr:Hypothetical predicted protein [Pelobates cultripes]
MEEVAARDREFWTTCGPRSFGGCGLPSQLPHVGLLKCLPVLFPLPWDPTIRSPPNQLTRFPRLVYKMAVQQPTMSTNTAEISLTHTDRSSHSGTISTLTVSSYSWLPRPAYRRMKPGSHRCLPGLRAPRGYTSNHSPIHG